MPSAARVLERLNFPWLVVTLAICALFALVTSWLPGWLLATAWLLSALGLAWVPSWSASSGVGLFSAHQFSIVTVWRRLTQQVRAVAGGIVIGAGLAMVFSIVLRYVASANIDIVSSARWSATAGLAIGLWRPAIVLALSAQLGRAVDRVRKAVSRP